MSSPKLMKGLLPPIMSVRQSKSEHSVHRTTEAAAPKEKQRGRERGRERGGRRSISQPITNPNTSPVTVIYIYHVY